MSVAAARQRTRVDERGELADAWVLLDGDTIAADGVGIAAPGCRRDASTSAERSSSPASSTCTVTAAGGHAYDDGGDELAAALAAHRAHGTTRAVISLVANPLAELRERLAEIADARRVATRSCSARTSRARSSPRERRGAHNAEFLRDPRRGRHRRAPRGGRRHAASGHPRSRTARARSTRSHELVGAGVVVAVGHTEATASRPAPRSTPGARLLTHAFNAMPGIHHRDPGPVVAAIDDERVTLELVLDGQHVHPDVARLLFRAGARPRRARSPTAMAAAGADDGDYRLGSLNVSVRDGLARPVGHLDDRRQRP